jgi:glucans biosynthesis protein C
LCVGFFVVQWAIPDILKWAVILLISFAIITVIYEYVVSRFNVMRFLFGMRVIPRQAEKRGIGAPGEAMRCS